MAKRICSECGDAIPSGMAHVRSVSFTQVNFCDFCHGIRQGEVLLAAFPRPRRSPLAERIASAQRGRIDA